MSPVFEPAAPLLPRAAGSGGRVYLIGAGPGDPGLITVRGRDCLQEADVIVYDRLVNPGLLRYARPEAELIFAGKTSGCHVMQQEEINRLLATRALQGQVVARLKGGDPFLFGRGGEEAEHLAACGVPFKVVPGVSSALAVPAYAGIPVTHRGMAASVAVLSGHSPQAVSSLGAGGIAADTLVVLMGMENLEQIVAQLLLSGKEPELPAAVVEWGTWPDQRVVTGTLRTIVDDVRQAGAGSPAVIVVGEVVRLRDRLQRSEKLTENLTYSRL